MDLRKNEFLKSGVSVIICTRNREKQIAQAVKSVLDNSYPYFNLLVVDQSNSNKTTEILKQFRSDERLGYIHTSTEGLSIARNIGVNTTTGSIIIYTDDDCTVSFDWIEQIVKLFEENLQVEAIFGKVEPASEFDLNKGWLPNFQPKANFFITEAKNLHSTGIMGANMAFRRSIVEQLNGFDELLGAGQTLQSAEDIDLAYRVLIKGKTICILSQASVIHYGYRAYQTRDGATTLINTMFGNGAYYAKHIRCMDKVASKTFFFELGRLIKSIILKIIKRQRPLGLKLPLFFLWGLVYSFRFRVDTKSRLFLSNRPSKKI